MSFVQDVTIGEGESVPPKTKFIKTWKIRNPGLLPHLVHDLMCSFLGGVLGDVI